MAIKEFNQYDPSEVSISFRNIRIRGFADKTFIEAERDEDGWMVQVGALGDVTRSRNLNIVGQVTITLETGCASNTFLEAMASLDEQFGTGFGPLQGVDHNSDTSEIHSTYAWVRKRPKWERGKESGQTAWVFHCADLEMHNGGNAPLPIP